MHAQISALHAVAPRYAELEGSTPGPGIEKAKKLKPRRQQPGGAGGGEGGALTDAAATAGELDVNVPWLCVLWMRALQHPNPQVCRGRIFCSSKQAYF